MSGESEPMASRELATFVAAVRSGTIQGASEAMCLTQSAATKRIQGLERRLRTTLLERTARGVSPTAAGQRLYPEACRALAALSAAEEAVDERPHTTTIRLAASHTTGEFLLPAWLSAFRTAEPNARPQVDVVNSPQVLKLLRADKIEVGFVEGDDPLHGFDSLTIARDEIVAVIGLDHPWVNRGSLRASELEAGPYIAREAGSGTRSIAEARLGRAGVRLSPTLALASLEGVKRALPGGGFTLISRLAVSTEIEAGSLAAVPIEGVDMSRRLLAVRKRSGLDAMAIAFWRFLEQRSERLARLPERRLRPSAPRRRTGPRGSDREQE